MRYDPARHHRRSIRLKGWDYAHPGWYYVNIVVRDRESHFGRIVNGKMELSPLGLVADAYWRQIPQHHPGVSLDDHIVMPNHLHGIVIINEKQHTDVKDDGEDNRGRGVSGRDAHGRDANGKDDHGGDIHGRDVQLNVPTGNSNAMNVPTGFTGAINHPLGNPDMLNVPTGNSNAMNVPAGSTGAMNDPSVNPNMTNVPTGSPDAMNHPTNDANAFSAPRTCENNGGRGTNKRMSPSRGSLSVIIRTFKAAVTTWAHNNGYGGFAWLGRFYDHIIRDQVELRRIREYIRNNPRNWMLDNDNPEADPVKAR